MARDRKYGNTAERQAAYRQRKRHERQDARPDRLILQLHLAIEQAALDGYGQAQLCQGAFAYETVKNLISHFETFSAKETHRKMMKTLQEGGF